MDVHFARGFLWGVSAIVSCGLWFLMWGLIGGMVEEYVNVDAFDVAVVGGVILPVIVVVGWAGWVVMKAG